MADSKTASPTPTSANCATPPPPTAVSRELPDIAKTTTSHHHTTLDWVGMSQIALPLQLPPHAPDGKKRLEINTVVSSTVQIFVNLNNPNVRGIHMSRLYLLLTEFAEAELLTSKSLRRFLKNLLLSHHDISDRAKLVFSFDQLIKQPALISQYSGWKSYPITVTATLNDDQVTLELTVTVPYSSTCPCSAALARQIIQERFHLDFSHQETVQREAVEHWLRSENGTLATPHSQRSFAKVRVRLSDDCDLLPIIALVEEIEKTLKTPVQTAVKREDEQEFARLNGQNLMFCEDAARQLKSRLMENKDYCDFWLQVNHLESLHAHDAVSIATRGIAGGYEPVVEDSR